MNFKHFNHRLYIASWLLMISWAAYVPGLHANEPLSISGWEIVRKLESGGYNIYFRHAETDWTQGDDVVEWGDWESCDPLRVRQLSDQGRDNAARVGQAIRVLDIPVGKVVASPYCRTMETAELMELGAVESDTDIINLRAADFFGGREAVLETARALLAVPPAKGTNTILVAHGNIAREITPVYPDEAEGVVVKPDGTGGYDYIARLTPDQWEQLVTLVDFQL